MKKPKRILAVSDIHGCTNKLVNVLDKAKYAPGEDLLVLLGDYIDRGPQSYETMQLVKYLVASGAIALLGNHEDMAMMAAKHEPGGLGLWLRNGGRETIKSYARNNAVISDDLEFLESLRLFYETEDYIFVHAGLDPIWQESSKTDRSVALWIRKEWHECNYIGRPVVFGHTPIKQVTTWPSGNRIAIDTGAVFYGKLSCLELPSKTVYEVGGSYE